MIYADIAVMEARISCLSNNDLERFITGAEEILTKRIESAIAAIDSNGLAEARKLANEVHYIKHLLDFSKSTASFRDNVGLHLH